MADQQPKRPLTAYFIWMGENREAIGKANPDLKSKELVKKLGETWRGITDKSVSIILSPLLLKTIKLQYLQNTCFLRYVLTEMGKEIQ